MTTDFPTAADGQAVVVDHKTCRRFADLDPGQLALYAEAVRQQRGCEVRTGAFDEYRLVPSLARVRTPVFRRSQVTIGPEKLPALRRRYQAAWPTMTALHRASGNPPRADDCWFCRPAW